MALEVLLHRLCALEIISFVYEWLSLFNSDLLLFIVVFLLVSFRSGCCYLSLQLIHCRLYPCVQCVSLFLINGLRFRWFNRPNRVARTSFFLVVAQWIESLRFFIHTLLPVHFDKLGRLLVVFVGGDVSRSRLLRHGLVSSRFLGEETPRKEVFDFFAWLASAKSHGRTATLFEW